MAFVDFEWPLAYWLHLGTKMRNDTYCHPNQNAAYQKSLTDYLVCNYNEFHNKFPYATFYIIVDFND